MSGAYRIALSRFTATIPINTALSGAVAIGSAHLVGIFMSADWTAADLTFQVSVDGGTTWGNMMSGSGSEVSMKADKGQYIAIDQDLWMGVNHLIVRSGTNALAVNQAAERVLTLIAHLHAW